MYEYVVPFPSAPIYGINRKADYNIEFPQRPNMHTLRVLKDAAGEGPVTRVFVLHNGLNETTNLRFYYRLAAWIFNEDAEAGHRSACVIAPFPGHLMHAPFSGPFAQTPLARYLGDSGELFRQYLRYMVELRWLLSLLVKKRPPEWTIGGAPLPRKDLASSLRKEWRDQRQASRHVWILRRIEELSPEVEERLLGPELSASQVERVIRILTHVFQLDDVGSPDEMPIHVAGYSLGGFLAQSVFFAWPNMISSCSTICSGGAIRALSPTAFANSEEWQAVLHTLRPELEESMLAGRIDREYFHIAGLPQDQFGYYQRIFDQVFLQEDKASYQARLSEYGTRMLFISGGEDPIVKTREVLDASPEEGITMLSIASLTHFLGEKPLTDREIAQRDFWLPEAGGLIGRAATRAEVLKREARRDARKEHEAVLRTLEDTPAADESDEADPPRERDLASPEFEGALEWVIDGVTSKEPAKPGSGWLFVCRSGLPAAFLDLEMHKAWATGLHHHDVSAQKYALGLAQRAKFLKEIKDRVTLVLPGGLKRTFVESGSGLVDPHSDAPGYLTTEQQRYDAWSEFLENWASHTRWLDAGPLGESHLDDNTATAHAKFAKEVSRWQRVPLKHLAVAHLPDVWISVDGLKPDLDAGEPEEAIKGFIRWVGGILAAEKWPRDRSSGPITATGGPGKQLEGELKSGLVRIVRVSGAELNPRYRGRYEKAFWPSILLLAHCAATLVRSREFPGPDPSQPDPA